MKDEEKNIFKPYVTLDQALNYDINRPETRTPSPLVDAVVEAFYVLKPFSMSKIAEYLGHPATRISAAIEIATGMNLNKFREEWTKKKVEIMQAENPKLTLDAIAREFGYANRSALWKISHREARKKEYRERKEFFERLERMTPEEKARWHEEQRRQEQEYIEYLLKHREK